MNSADTQQRSSLKFKSEALASFPDLPAFSIMHGSRRAAKIPMYHVMWTQGGSSA